MKTRVACAALVGAALAAVPSTCRANLVFASTTSPQAWQVAVNTTGVDGQFSSFPTSGFGPAVNLTNRPEWIADVTSGTHGPVGSWTFFVFRQTFDLTGYDPNAVVLQFQWGADDSGEGFASRGTWNPKYRLNFGDLVPNTAGFYDYGPTVTLSSGFVPGINTLDFFVEGNGTTDGFGLRTISVQVPEPASLALLLAGCSMLLRRRTIRS